MSFLLKSLNNSINQNNQKKIDDLIKLYKETIEKNHYQTTHDELLELFNLNPENKNARIFAGLINEGNSNPNEDQLKVIGGLINELNKDNSSLSFIKAALEKDKLDKNTLGLDITNNNDKYIDLRYFIIEALKQPQVSNINSIGSLGLLKEIMSLDNVRSRNQVIHNEQNSANLKPLIDKIEKVSEANPSGNDISDINTIASILESMFNNKENEEKLKEIKELMDNINKQYRENQERENLRVQKEFEEQEKNNELNF